LFTAVGVRETHREYIGRQQVMRTCVRQYARMYSGSKRNLERAGPTSDRT